MTPWASKPHDRIDPHVVDVHLEVQVRPGRLALGADAGNQLSRLHVGGGPDEQLIEAHVPVDRLDAAGMLQDDPVAEALRRPPVEDVAFRRRVDRGAERCRQIDTGVGAASTRVVEQLAQR